MGVMTRVQSLTEKLNSNPIQLPSSLKNLHLVGFDAKPFKKDKSHFPHLGNQPLLTQSTQSTANKPLHVGVVFSGGQAPGGHNVLWGLLDALKKIHPKSRLTGFKNGPKGFLNNHSIEITEALIEPFKNIGGFHLMGSGRTKIETSEQFEEALKVSKQQALDAFVIIGGDDSNTNAALLAEYFSKHQLNTSVIGVPKTIDGDLKNEHVEVSFGFDTAATVYCELIGNLLFDALSSKKYYHFVKLMGRSASHLTLECALKTQPNFVLIGEEIAQKNISLDQITDQICNLVKERAKENKNYGLILIPEGLIEFIPEFTRLNEEVSELLAHQEKCSCDQLIQKLSKPSQKILSSLPQNIQEQLLLERDSHGNIPLAKIETEKLLAYLVQKKLKSEKDLTFNPLTHYFGYEGRAAHPTPFDAHYCYLLGTAAALLAAHQKSGYMAYIQNLQNGLEDWKVGGLPINQLVHLEKRHGKEKLVIKKALVNLEGYAFDLFTQKQKDWHSNDRYLSPGPAQLFMQLHELDNPNYLLKSQVKTD